MQIVIICGGLATRLGNLSKNIPKSMLDIQGKPFLEYQIEYLKKHSIKDIILCVGYLSETIEKYFGNGKKFGVNIKYSYDGEKLLGPMGAVKNAESKLDDIFFIMYGDSYISVDFQKVHSYFLKHNKLGLMVVYKNCNKYDNSNLSVRDNLVIGHKVSGITEDINYIDYGTSLLRKKSLALIPEDSFCSTEQFFIKLINKKELLAYEANKRFYHIGTPESLEEFRDFIKNQ
jgi:NDP-sugar pyrophosphorylase family protein